MEFWSKNRFINVYRRIKISKLVKFKKISFKKNIYKETPVLKLNSQKSNKYLSGNKMGYRYYNKEFRLDKFKQKNIEKLVKIKLKII